MKDKNGRPIGVLAHELKTHVTESSGADMITNLNKDLDKFKINDDFSNVEILSYKNPKSQTNKQTILSNVLDASDNHDKK